MYPAAVNNDSFGGHVRREVAREKHGDVAEVVAEYGPDQILVETDSAGVLRSDVFAFKRTILEMYRMGLDTDTIRRVVYENPQQLLG